MSKLSTTEIETISALFHKASSEDMGVIREMFNYNSAKKQARTAATFSVGDTVYFSSKRGPVTGTIMKINRKTIKVDGGKLGLWSVSPALLKKA